MVSSCNAEIQKMFIGIWIPILRELLHIYSEELNESKIDILDKLISDSDVKDSKILSS